MTTTEGTETCTAGDLYYMEPGHTLFVEADVELVEFSPSEEMARLGEVLRRTFAEAHTA